MNIKRFWPVILIFTIIYLPEIYSAMPVNLEDIVITPYKIPLSLKTTALSTKIIYLNNGKENNFDRTLNSAVFEDSSVVYSQNGAFGGASTIFLRGNSSHHTRFLLDGVKIYDPMLTQSYYNPTHFYLNGIEKIEISKGQQSALYGSDAIGGVIQLFTRPATKSKGYSYRQEFGRYYTFIEELEMERIQNNLGIVFSALRFDSHGFSATQEKENNHERDPYHNTNLSLRLDYQFSEDNQLSSINRFIAARYEYDGSDPITWQPTDDNDRIGHDYQGINTIIWKKKLSEQISFTAQGAVTNYYRTYHDDSDNIDGWYRAKTYQTNYSLSYNKDKYQLLIGAEYLREKGDSYYFDGSISDFPKKTLDNKAIFIEQIYNPFSALTLVFSYRYDDYSQTKNKGTKSLDINYAFVNSDFSISARYGEGFKAPSLYQLFAPASAWGPIGNENLSPEYSKSYEIGIKGKITPRLMVNTVYFRNFYRNLIDFVAGVGYSNVSKARCYGLENEIIFSYNKNWQISLGYTWLDSENKETHAQLERRPKNKLNFAINGQWEKLQMETSLTYVGHRTQGTTGSTLLKSYILWNALANYKLNENTNIFLRLENILDQKYELVDHYQTKKFFISCGWKIKF